MSSEENKQNSIQKPFGNIGDLIKILDSKKKENPLTNNQIDTAKNNINKLLSKSTNPVTAEIFKDLVHDISESLKDGKEFSSQTFMNVIPSLMTKMQQKIDTKQIDMTDFLQTVGTLQNDLIGKLSPAIPTESQESLPYLLPPLPVINFSIDTGHTGPVNTEPINEKSCVNIEPYSEMPIELKNLIYSMKDLKLQNMPNIKSTKKKDGVIVSKLQNEINTESKKDDGIANILLNEINELKNRQEKLEKNLADIRKELDKLYSQDDDLKVYI